MTEVPQPDWAALYQRHRDAMYRVASATLRAAGREDEAEDAVMAAIESLMKSPPNGVRSWEAMLVFVTKNRAKDMLGSAAARHELGGGVHEHDAQTPEDVAAAVAERIDLEGVSAKLRDSLPILDAKHRHVAWEYVAMARPRGEVAAELGVSPARVSQIATECLKLLRDELEGKGVKP